MSQSINENASNDITCEHCHAVIQEGDHVTTNDNSVFCDETCAIAGGYFLCYECGEWEPEDEQREDPEGRAICEDCYDREGYHICDHCGNIIDENDATWVEANDYTVCPRCLERKYWQCEDCGGWVPRGDTICIQGGVGDYFVCERCYGSGSYFCCDSCGCHYDEDHCGGYSLCQGCYQPDEDDDNDSRIHFYSWTPTPYQFNRSDKDAESQNLYLGIELEIETPSGGTREACDYVEEMPSLYMKEDGSINHGFEIVSHPGTLNHWQEQREAFSRLLSKLNNLGCDASCQGLHVHISKAGMTEGHRIRFQSFFDANNAILPTIARRSESHWAKYKELSHGQWKNATAQSERYRAVNWLPSRTVEVRMFRGTLDINEFFASVEFCHAAYQFTKNQVSLATIATGKSWKAFCDFLKNDKRYCHLVKYLKNNEIYGAAKAVTEAA